ncbi:hypothetical protein AMECASPLE_018021 [Ameca splendens]|uniref:Uncharacterized protein n=1 Tax=Ameca splendens TaxID=208324 RepID=A0ABV0ZYY8_9TELE
MVPLITASRPGPAEHHTTTNVLECIYKIIFLGFFWDNFSRPDSPGKVYHCSMFSPIDDNGSHSGVNLRNSFVLLPMLLDVSHNVSSRLLNFFRWGHDLSF